MKKLVALLLVSMMATVAFAGIDPDTDSMGIYFDAAGNTVELAAAPFAQFNAYLLLMNPGNTTDGFECTVTVTPTGGAAFFALGNAAAGAGPVDVDSVRLTSTDGWFGLPPWPVVPCAWASAAPTAHTQDASKIRVGRSNDVLRSARGTMKLVLSRGPHLNRNW